jgi:AraC-like DNA-binding protein
MPRSSAGGQEARAFDDGRRWTAWQGGRATDLETWYSLVGGGDPMPSTITMLDDDRFTAELRRCTLDGFVLDVLDVDAAPHVVTRSPQHIAHHTVAEHMVLFQFSGSSAFSQAGATATMRSGDVAIGSSLISYSWAFHEPVRVMALRVDRDRVSVPFSALTSLIARPIRARTGIVSYVARFAEALADDPELFDGAGGQRLVEGLYAMCEGGFLVAQDDASSSHASTRERVLTATRRRLQDPQLRLTDIAAASFLSRRQVQRVFEAEGSSFGAWVRLRRLEAVRRDLKHPGNVGERLGVIAARWGFPDQAHFSRAFREQYGETPTRYRARAAAVQREIV